MTEMLEKISVQQLGNAWQYNWEVFTFQKEARIPQDSIKD